MHGMYVKKVSISIKILIITAISSLTGGYQLLHHTTLQRKSEIIRYLAQKLPAQIPDTLLAERIIL